MKEKVQVLGTATFYRSRKFLVTHLSNAGVTYNLDSNYSTGYLSNAGVTYNLD